MLYSDWGAFKNVLNKSWKFQLPELLPLQAKHFPHINNLKIYNPSKINFHLASSLSCHLFFWLSFKASFLSKLHISH